MYKVIVYGVYAIEMRRQIEHFLDDEYCIIGYSDSFLEEDIVEGKQFIPLDEISSTDFDYVVLALVEEKESVTDMLVMHGIPAGKIVWPELLRWSNSAKMQRNIVREIDECKCDDVELLIFGLSYSRRGIVQNRIPLKLFNYSCPGLDIYYNAKLYEYTKTNNLWMLKAVNYAFWVIPYYYFDYDMSKSLSQYTSGQISVIARLNDWHNASEDVLVKRYIESFRMFEKKVHKFYACPASPVVKKRWEGDEKKDLLGAWSRQYLETIDENVKILRSTIDDLQKYGCKVTVIVPPMFVEGMTPDSQLFFYEKRRLFFEICENYFSDVEIWDFAEEYKDRADLFDSLDHLNYFGAGLFTDKLNEKIKIMCDGRRQS